MNGIAAALIAPFASIVEFCEAHKKIEVSLATAHRCSHGPAVRFAQAGVLLFVVLTTGAAHAQSSCNVGLSLTPDYQYAIGTSIGGGTYTFTLNGQPIATGSVAQLALFHFDNSLNSTSGTGPSSGGTGAAFDVGKFGQGMYLQSGGAPTYPGSLFNVSEGTVEMWVALRFDGDDPVFANADDLLFFYSASNGDFLTIAIDGQHTGRVIYTGATVNGQWESAYGADITAWKAGEWHHIAATFSASASHIRFYVDGVKVADNNEGHFYAPSSVGGSFQVGSTVAAIDELRISDVALPDGLIADDSSRSTPFANDEVAISLAGVSPGQLVYSVAGCGTSSPYTFTGIPISNFSPPSGLLPPGNSSVAVSFNSIQPTTCRYSVGKPLDYSAMQPLDAGTATATHNGIVSRISTNPQVLNQVYIRCASNLDYLQSETYRVVAAPSGPFPRIGNIWLGHYLNQTRPDLSQKVQLFFGANMSASEALALRAHNPDVLVLPSTQVDDTGDTTLPETYYLHDTNGKRIYDWCVPPLAIYNMTRPEVATYIGQQAYQLLSQSKWAFDGMFFDSFHTTFNVNFTDCYGNNVQIDSNGDGLPDDQAQLNAAWSAGQFLAVNTFHNLAPGAYIAGHVLEAPAEPQELAAFNATALEFFQQNIRQGQESFGTLWNLYQSWETQAVAPSFALMQSAPPNQIAYGYGYQPLNVITPELATFAETFYPNMRFGLALTLMRDGFFSFDFGDEAPPTAWWYDEYDFDLGYPLGPAVRIGDGSSANLVANGGFENTLQGSWSFYVGSGSATEVQDCTVAHTGSCSAHVNVTALPDLNWKIDLEQDNLPLIAGHSYQVTFWARADQPRVLTISSQGGAPNYTFYGLDGQFSLGITWALYTATFSAPLTANDGRLEFWFGDATGQVWIDDVQLLDVGKDIFRRDFTNGTVLLNGTSSPQTITPLTNLRRFQGTQAPLYQYIVDDGNPGFTTTGSWLIDTINPLPVFQGIFPSQYYHAWQGTCHELDASSGTAQWNLSLPADGTYTIQVWLPAAPSASTWTKNAVYEVVSNGSVIASASLDQSTASSGDGWHTVATAVNLTAADAPILRVHNGGSGPLIADAVYVTSAALYNDGSPVTEVTLAPFDGILLQHDPDPSITPARPPRPQRP